MADTGGAPYDDERYRAWCELLSLPDADDLPRRYRYTYAGDAAMKDRIKWTLAAAYIGHQMQARGEDGVIVSVRRFRLRLVRRSA